MGRKFLIVPLLLVACGCGSDPTAAGPATAGGASGRLRILATTGMIADAARRVGGDLVEVTALMGPGVDPHLYQPTARDQSQLKAAQLILYNGLHLEGKMAELFESLSKQKHVVAVSHDLPTEKLLSWRESAGMHDPHIWFDVTLWQQAVRTISRACSEADPAHAADFEQRSSDYLAELEHLDRECHELADRLPRDRRVLITSHDAFHYFGKAYGFDVVGIQGISTETEAGLKAITDAVDLIRRRKIRAIFPETSVSRAAIERVATDGHVSLGSELYSDSLGSPDSPAGTYVGMIRANMENIVKSLQGSTTDSAH
ncbi:MAG: zinc ABC transporter substrate-binding protein [Planctomycetia bacterium]|nr:zinc ABC transporter substrate-binding protein [Planctomycetia bacterium]